MSSPCVQAVVPSSWQRELAAAYRSPAELARAGLMAAAEAEAWQGHPFRFRLTHSYAELFDPAAGPACPIRRQAIPGPDEVDPVLPAWAEQLSRRAYGRGVPWHKDPIGDQAWLGAARLTHRYASRAIVHVSTSCAVYCRFCFRKHHLSARERALYGGPLGPALAYLAAHPEVREVILTGGDPLSLSDSALTQLVAQLAEVPHLRRVRLHSRMPATLPARLTSELARALSESRLTCILMAHFNHPRELSARARRQLEGWRRAGITLLNQAVLMRGINDRVEVLHELFEALGDTGVVPIYLHQADWTAGTFGFRVAVARGQALMEALPGRLAGLSLPRYVVDLPGGGGKASLTDCGVTCLERYEDRGVGLGGALYQIPRPQLRQPHRAEEGRFALYADLYRL